jgi:alpha-N-acetylglucosaminidase
MRHYNLFLFILFLFISIVYGQTAKAENATCREALNLINRVLPGKADKFKVEIIPSENGKDVFEIEKSGNAIVLRGNNTLSLAVAFNTYLKEIALISYDWLADAPIQLNQELPLPSLKTRRVCSAKERFFNNTCTFGYTFPYWGCERWDRFIDWMAMNGINRPLMAAGQEATWLRVWKSFGMSDKQVRAYFSAPAHLPWHRMANMDKWGGPLPLSYILSQEKLQKHLLSRCRALGMKPILTAFAGHVPAELRALFPQVKISVIKPGWGGMDPIYTTCYLDPKEPLFTEIQRRFITTQQQMYGTDHLYSADPFNEITPPSWKPEYLASVGKTIYESMAKSDPKAVWYQMSWAFYFDQEHWTQPRLTAMVKAVPKGKLAFLDYNCEEVEYFRKSESFSGAPFIWCYLGNFGGNTHIVAPLRKVVNRINNIPENSGCLGVGSTLEGINVNSVIYETVLEIPWLNKGDRNLNNILQKYADRRTGKPDEAVRKAWHTLATKVLVDSSIGIWNHSVIYQVSPVLDIKKRHWTTDPTIPYNNADLLEVTQQLLQANDASKQTAAYQYDLVNFTRQLLGNYGIELYHNMMSAYNQKNLGRFMVASEEFLALGYEIDNLLGTKREFLLGPWLADAVNAGKTPEEKKYYERDAREIITTWHKGGSDLTDYSNRQWNGLMRTYYLERWKEFIARLETSLSAGRDFDEKDFTVWCARFEQSWVDNTTRQFSTEVQSDPVNTATNLIKKYETRITSKQ